MKKISVIVPVYNTEKYISRCLDHLLNQTYKNMEIIVVDDASTDNSASIVKKYAEKYNNIIFIQNKENKKTFETKRIGMETATGDYIGFCDSDDYLELESYEYLLNIIESDDYDMATCGYVNNENNWSKANIKNTIIYNNGEVLYDFLTLKILHHMSESLFKKDVIKNALKDVNNYIRLAHAEDFLWRAIIYFYIKKSIHSNKELYNYCKNIESVSHSNSEFNTIITRIIDYSIMLDEFKKILLLHNSYKNMKDIYFDTVKRHAINSFNILKEYEKDYFNIWRKNASENLKNGLILYYDGEINKYKNEINKYKNDINKYKKDLNNYTIITNRINIADILFSISLDNNYMIFMIIGIKIKIKKDSFVKIVSWWIPIKKWRNNFRNKFK